MTYQQYPLLYVAHKIRDPRGPFYMRENIRQGERVALELWRMGAAVICPGKNTMWFDGAADDSVWLEGDLKIVSRCDAVVMAPNWVDSDGAKKERAFAMGLNIPVFRWGEEGEGRRIKSFIYKWAKDHGE